jgi:hypothetical protein
MDSQDNYLYIAKGQPCLQQCDILYDRIILAIATAGLQSLERRAPMIRRAPLRLITGGHDGKINRSINQADTGATRAARAFSDDIEQASCNSRTCFSRAAARQHSLLSIDIGLDRSPFRRNFSGNGFGFQAE